MQIILHWNPRFGNSVGGGEIYISNIIQNMLEFNHLIISNRSLPKSNNDFYKGFEKNIIYSNPPNITYPKIITFPYNMFSELIRLNNKKNIHKSIKPDLNIIHGIGLFGPLERLYFKSGLDFINKDYFKEISPKILTIHNLYSPLILKKNERYVKYENKLFDQFDTFICIDRNIYSFLKKRNPSKKSYYIPNSIPDYFFRNKSRKKQYNPKSPVLGFVGRYEYSRGIHILKKMVEETPKSFKFLLIFSTGDKIKQKIKKEFSSKENIELYYNIPNKDLVSYYQKMDYLFNPVLVKGISRVSLEAMASAVIPIMLDLGDRYPIIDSKTGILFKEENLYDLIDKIQNLPGMKYHEMQKNAKNISKEKFSNSIIIKKLKEIYTMQMKN